MKFTFPPESKPLDGYTIKRAIQRGGFGEVYYALSDGGKEVALKLLLQNTEIELRGVSQCLNLKHPNLVTIFDIRTDADGDHWIVMEFVSGKNLDKVIEEHKSGMPIEDVQHWLSGIAAGLSFLHDRGIVHRDLKPGNFMLTALGVKLLDFGLAKLTASERAKDVSSLSSLPTEAKSLTAEGSILGTFQYMAPEQLESKDVDARTDLFALGAVLYEMFTGRKAFEGESQASLIGAIM
ncbi:MAG: serine/threonine protein kinase, partial [Planctomycetes bacterium]|nr:serine/threonine protein kinase [Planctomycetota bacterium]